MAMQEYPFDVYIKGPLTIGTNLAPDKIKATLHLEQLQDESKDLAHLVRANSGGLKIGVAEQTAQLQGLTATAEPGLLTLNPAGGDLQLGNTSSQVAVPGTLHVTQGIRVGDDFIITHDGEWRGKPGRLSTTITDVTVKMGEPGSQATARLEEIANAGGNKRLCLESHVVTQVGKAVTRSQPETPSK